jgi:hypothetical protein
MRKREILLNVKEVWKIGFELQDNQNSEEKKLCIFCLWKFARFFFIFCLTFGNEFFINLTLFQ